MTKKDLVENPLVTAPLRSSKPNLRMTADMKKSFCEGLYVDIQDNLIRNKPINKTTYGYWYYFNQTRSLIPYVDKVPYLWRWNMPWRSRLLKRKHTNSNSSLYEYWLEMRSIFYEGSRNYQMGFYTLPINCRARSAYWSYIQSQD